MKNRDSAAKDYEYGQQKGNSDKLYKKNPVAS